MAIKIIRSEQKADKPYLNVHIESMSKSDKAKFDESIHFVSLVKVSKKGLILETVDFVAFVWKNSPEGKMLIEWLDDLQDDSSESLFVVIDLSSRYFFAIAFDDEVGCEVVLNEKTQTYYFRNSPNSIVPIEVPEPIEPPKTSLKPSKGKAPRSNQGETDHTSRTSGSGNNDADDVF